MWKNKVSLFNCEDIFVSTQKVRLFITNPSNTYQLAILRSVNVETVVIYKWWIFAILPIVKLHGNWWDLCAKIVGKSMQGRTKVNFPVGFIAEGLEWWWHIQFCQKRGKICGKFIRHMENMANMWEFYQKYVKYNII